MVGVEGIIGFIVFFVFMVFIVIITLRDSEGNAPKVCKYCHAPLDEWIPTDGSTVYKKSKFCPRCGKDNNPRKQIEYDDRTGHVILLFMHFLYFLWIAVSLVTILINISVIMSAAAVLNLFLFVFAYISIRRMYVSCPECHAGGKKKDRFCRRCGTELIKSDDENKDEKTDEKKDAE